MGGFKKTRGQVEIPLDRRETPPDECNDTLSHSIIPLKRQNRMIENMFCPPTFT